jgi:hypothetical protein
LGGDPKENLVFLDHQNGQTAVAFDHEFFAHL